MVYQKWCLFGITICRRKARFLYRNKCSDMYNSFKKKPIYTQKKNKQKTHKKPHSINFRLRGCIKRLKRINMALPKNSRSTLPSDCKKKSEVQNLSYFIFWIGLSERKKHLNIPLIINWAFNCTSLFIRRRRYYWPNITKQMRNWRMIAWSTMHLILKTNSCTSI